MNAQIVKELYAMSLCLDFSWEQLESIKLF